MDIILASTSPYRRALLSRLQIPFRCEAPETEEQRLPGEAPGAMAGRLSIAKAVAVAERFPGALVIGSDQVATIDGDILGKPGSHDNAAAQLQRSSGREVRFYTGLALAGGDLEEPVSHVEPFDACFRELSDARIEEYLRREEPYDCAGSFKCEGLGISLFTALRGDDPTSLEGLPLIALCSMLYANNIL